MIWGSKEKNQSRKCLQWQRRNKYYQFPRWISLSSAFIHHLLQPRIETNMIFLLSSRVIHNILLKIAEISPISRQIRWRSSRLVASCFLIEGLHQALRKVVKFDYRCTIRTMTCKKHCYTKHRNRYWKTKADYEEKEGRYRPLSASSCYLFYHKI